MSALEAKCQPAQKVAQHILGFLKSNSKSMPLCRFACDGLKRQRLTVPMMKDNNGEMKVVDWKDAIVTVAKVLDSTPADKMAAVAGGLADAEVTYSLHHLYTYRA